MTPYPARTHHGNAEGSRAGTIVTAVKLEVTTATWNVVEAGVALASGIVAGSEALTGFGLDSAIEVASALIVLTRLRAVSLSSEPDERRERRALRAVAVLFFVLAAYLVADGVYRLIVADHPDNSVSGLAVAGAALIVMPLLAHAKTRVGRRMGGAVGSLVLADAAETRLCALLSVATIGGVVAYSVAGWWWADPIAGFVIVYFALAEGQEAWRGDLCSN